jgi:hypothetical protein
MARKGREFCLGGFAMHGVAILVLSIISLSSPRVVAPHHFAGRAVSHHAAATDRVWTNDDVKTLREEAPISIIGTVQGLEASTSVSTTREAMPERRLWVKDADPDWYAQEIEARRIEAARAQAELAQIAYTVKTGDGFSDVVPLDTTTPGILLPGSIYVLQQEVREAHDDIGALQDMGRHNGILVAAWR